VQFCFTITNFNIRHYSRKNDGKLVIDRVISDTTDYRENNATIRQDISISHDIDIRDVRNSINLVYSNSKRNDLIEDRSVDFTFNTMSSQMVRAGVKSTFGFPLVTNISFSTNKNESGLSSTPYEFTSLSLRGQYDFFNEQVRTIAGYSLTNGSGIADFTQNNVYISARYKFLRIHQIDGRLKYTMIDDRKSDESFNDLSFSLIYSMAL
jgi:hypothetical protein